MKTIKIAIYKGNSRYKNIFNSLNLIKSDILNKIKNKDNIVIKPNCVSDTNQLASVHVYYIMNYENLDPSKIKIIGNTTIEKEKRKFKLHENIKSQINWKID